MQKRLVLLAAAAAAALTMLAAPAGASGTAPPFTQHDRDVVRFFQRHPRLARSPTGERVLWQLIGRVVIALRTTQGAGCGAAAAACAWYADGATQCEVAHEGGFTSVSPDGIYAGRFQSDGGFETETPFGRGMEARYGRANNWPAWAQIQHAYEVWSYSGWSRWPPYYRYGCAAYHGGTYH